MTTNNSDQETGAVTYKVREAVALFNKAAALEAAADELMAAGIPRSDLSLLGTDTAIEQKLSRHYKRASQLEDDPEAKQTAFVASEDVAAGQAALFGIPVYIGAMAGTAAVAATGGALGFIILAAAAGGMAGGAIGAVAANALGEHHAAQLEDKLKQGGLLLWVRLRDNSKDEEIVSILKKAGGHDVHIHELERVWGEKDIPLHDFNPDPLLEK